jgi:hypothetical protein
MIIGQSRAIDVDFAAQGFVEFGHFDVLLC